MQNFSQWLDDFTIEQQINLNDRFTFNRENGAKEVYTVGQIFEFIKAQSEEAQDKFADSLQRGLKAQNLMGYLYSASKYFKIQQDKQQQKERQPEAAKENKQADNKLAKEQVEIKDSAAAKFEDLEKKQGICFSAGGKPLVYGVVHHRLRRRYNGRTRRKKQRRQKNGDGDDLVSCRHDAGAGRGLRQH